MGQLVESATRTLAATSDSPRLDAELLLAEAVGVSRTTVIAFPERIVETEVKDAFERLDLHRMLSEPEMLEAVTPDVHLVAISTGDTTVTIPEPPADLAASIFEKTSASPCRRAETMIMDRKRTIEKVLR